VSLVLAGGAPIWAGIGLMLLAAVAGTMAARARNRRLMRKYQEDQSTEER
jgi:UPF0716 family protein affecting phage T7 exclusion